MRWGGPAVAQKGAPSLGVLVPRLHADVRLAAAQVVVPFSRWGLPRMASPPALPSTLVLSHLGGGEEGLGRLRSGAAPGALVIRAGRGAHAHS
eukprot:3211019-Alexandrium_andersonii.AAC.1